MNLTKNHSRVTQFPIQPGQVVKHQTLGCFGIVAAIRFSPTYIVEYSIWYPELQQLDEWVSQDRFQTLLFVEQVPEPSSEVIYLGKSEKLAA